MLLPLKMQRHSIVNDITQGPESHLEILESLFDNNSEEEEEEEGGGTLGGGTHGRIICVRL